MNIYIYIYRIVSLFVVFKRQTNKISGWCSLSMLLNFSESEAFAGEDFVLGEISFLILWFFGMDIGYLLSANPKNRRFPWEQTFLINKPITDHFICSYFLTAQPIKCTDLCLWEKYPFCCKPTIIIIITISIQWYYKFIFKYKCTGGTLLLHVRTFYN